MGWGIVGNAVSLVAGHRGKESGVKKVPYFTPSVYPRLSVVLILVP